MNCSRKGYEAKNYHNNVSWNGMGIKTMEKTAGEYYLHGVRETASGFKLNGDGSFQFFFTYGALDRYGLGIWTIENDHVILQSKPWSGKDFALIESSTSGKGITVKITDKNPILQKHVFASLQKGEDGSWQPPDAKGEIHFPSQDVNTICLVFEFCPERFTVFPVTNKGHNFFEFRLEPWIMEVFFAKFQLKIGKYALSGKHPLLQGEKYEYEKR
jgi:hypothetical protein